MPFDPALVARVAAALAGLRAPGIREKHVFGGRGFLAGTSTFVVCWDDGLIVKTPPAEYAESLATPGVVPFAPDGSRPMTTWVVVPEALVADDPELTAWVARGLRGVGREARA